MPHVAGAGGRFWCPCCHSTTYKKKLKHDALGCCRTSVHLVKLPLSSSHLPHSNFAQSRKSSEQALFFLDCTHVRLPSLPVLLLLSPKASVLSLPFDSSRACDTSLNCLVFLTPYIVPLKVRFLIKLGSLKFQGPSFRWASLKESPVPAFVFFCNFVLFS